MTNQDRVKMTLSEAASRIHKMRREHDEKWNDPMGCIHEVSDLVAAGQRRGERVLRHELAEHGWTPARYNEEIVKRTSGRVAYMLGILL